jgi:hypothetical protein
LLPGVGHVLDHVGLAGELQQRPRGRDQVGVLVGAAECPVDGAEVEVALTRRAGVDDVELPPVSGQVAERVALVELERVARLRRDVHADERRSTAARW